MPFGKVPDFGKGPEIGDIGPIPPIDRVRRGHKCPIFLPAELPPKDVMEILENIELPGDIFFDCFYFTPVDVFLGDTQIIDNTALEDITPDEVKLGQMPSPMSPEKLEEIIELIPPNTIIIKVVTPETEPVFAILV